jgi:hypothetical protein
VRASYAKAEQHQATQGTGPSAAALAIERDFRTEVRTNLECREATAAFGQALAAAEASAQKLEKAATAPRGGLPTPDRKQLARIRAATHDKLGWVLALADNPELPGFTAMWCVDVFRFPDRSGTRAATWVILRPEDPDSNFRRWVNATPRLLHPLYRYGLAAYTTANLNEPTSAFEVS